MNIALTSFKAGEIGSTLLEREERAWTNRMDRIALGENWAAEDERIGNDALSTRLEMASNSEAL
ncbi:hypothetical protein ACEXQB_001640 [Herbiconiux sp. P18]|uniref:hypothetical protein n=1 Tax=Herbiconiux liangxiaofengii TaxID=3342795 RepID=UPI0035B78728